MFRNLKISRFDTAHNSSPYVWGSNPVATPTGSATNVDRMLKQGLLIRAVLILARGYARCCQRLDTVSAGKVLLERRQVTYLLTQQFGCKGDGDEIAPIERREQ